MMTTKERLAGFASVAEFVDRSLLRMLRTRFLEDADAGDEVAIWWSDHVEDRGGNGLTFTTRALASLRAHMADDPLRAEVVEAVRQHHAGGPPLLLVQEAMVALELARAGTEDFEKVLAPVVEALAQPTREDEILAWMRLVVDRIPSTARATGAWTQLSMALFTRYAIPLALDADPLERPPPGGTWMQWLPKAETDRRLDVRVIGDDIFLVDSGRGTIAVPATRPPMVFVNASGVWRSMAIPSSGAVRLGRAGEEPILETLRGQRYAVRAAGRAESMPEVQVDTGVWVLVDGTSDFTVPPQEVAVAEAVGTYLAREGHSLVTFGTAGIAHLAARAFMRELRAVGFRSGIYRLIHVVAEEGQPDFKDGGRTILVGRDELVASALARASCVCLIGGSNHERVILEADPHLIKLSHIGEKPEQAVRQNLDGLVAQVPSAPIFESARFLLVAAARALDEQDLDGYNVRLRELAAAVTDRAALLRDSRASHRLLGYSAEARAPIASVLIDALVRELATVRLFSETRPLYLALELAAGERYVRPPQARALAAVLRLIATALQRPGVDPRGEMLEMVEELTLPDDSLEENGSSRARAAALANLARRYQEERARPAGDDRTARMERIASEVASKFGRIDGAMPEAAVWLEGGDGGRIVALGLVEGSAEPAGLPVVLATLSQSRSPFEQYRSLVAARAIASELDLAGRREVRGRIALERESGRISRDDPSRWRMSDEVLRLLDDSLMKSTARAVEQRLRSGEPSEPSSGLDTRHDLRDTVTVVSRDARWLNRVTGTIVGTVGADVLILATGHAVGNSRVAAIDDARFQSSAEVIWRSTRLDLAALRVEGNVERPAIAVVHDPDDAACQVIGVVNNLRVAVNGRIYASADETVDILVDDRYEGRLPTSGAAVTIEQSVFAVVNTSLEQFGPHRFRAVRLDRLGGELPESLARLLPQTSGSGVSLRDHAVIVANAAGRIGTGTVIGRDSSGTLIMTAERTFEESPLGLEVRHQGIARSCRVLWTSKEGGLALLHADVSLPVPRLGSLGNSNRFRCVAYFDAVRGLADIGGAIIPKSTRTAGLKVDGAVVSWVGASGAPIFVNNVLIGVLNVADDEVVMISLEDVMNHEPIVASLVGPMPVSQANQSVSPALHLMLRTNVALPRRTLRDDVVRARDAARFPREVMDYSPVSSEVGLSWRAAIDDSWSFVAGVNGELQYSCGLSSPASFLRDTQTEQVETLPGISVFRVLRSVTGMLSLGSSILKSSDSVAVLVVEIENVNEVRLSFDESDARLHRLDRPWNERFWNVDGQAFAGNRIAIVRNVKIPSSSEEIVGVAVDVFGELASYFNFRTVGSLAHNPELLVQYVRRVMESEDPER